jgi:hypothetical protein
VSRAMHLAPLQSLAAPDLLPTAKTKHRAWRSLLLGVTVRRVWRQVEKLAAVSVLGQFLILRSFVRGEGLSITTHPAHGMQARSWHVLHVSLEDRPCGSTIHC